jgi:hypothetical protein
MPSSPGCRRDIDQRCEFRYTVLNLTTSIDKSYEQGYATHAVRMMEACEKIGGDA